MKIKCKVCGCEITPDEDESLVVCEFCGSEQTFPNLDDEHKIELFNEANTKRIENRFDEALKIYEHIIEEFPTELDAYWNLLLCKYGIEFVDDSKTGKKIPTCHRTITTSILDEPYLKKILKKATFEQGSLWKSQAEEIDKLQKDILNAQESIDAYDIFICYKENDFEGNRTKDSLYATSIYTDLIDKGYKVFFAKETLKEVIGNYEPYIFRALSTAKLMLVIGTTPDFLNAQWVRNEWSRFIDIKKIDDSKAILPCITFEPYDLPEELREFQARDLKAWDFEKQLTFKQIDRIFGRNIDKTTGETVKIIEREVAAKPDASVSIARAFDLIKNEKYIPAAKLLNDALLLEPDNGKIYLGLLLTDLFVNNLDKLATTKQSFEDNFNYKQALEKLPKDDAETLEEYCALNKKNRLAKPSPVQVTRPAQSEEDITASLTALATDCGAEIEFEKINNENGYDGITLTTLFEAYEGKELARDIFFISRKDVIKQYFSLWNKLSIESKSKYAINPNYIDEIEELALSVVSKFNHVSKTNSHFEDVFLELMDKFGPQLSTTSLDAFIETYHLYENDIFGSTFDYDEAEDDDDDYDYDDNEEDDDDDYEDDEEEEEEEYEEPKPQPKRVDPVAKRKASEAIMGKMAEKLNKSQPKMRREEDFSQFSLIELCNRCDELLTEFSNNTNADTLLNLQDGLVAVKNKIESLPLSSRGNLGGATNITSFFQPYVDQISSFNLMVKAMPRQLIDTQIQSIRTTLTFIVSQSAK